MVSKLRLKCGHLVIFLCPKTCTKAHIQNGTQPDFIAKEMWPLNQCGEMLRDLSQTPPKTEELEPELEEMLQVTIKTVADPKNFKGGGVVGRQFISSVLIYPKCVQRNICFLHGKKRLFDKNMSQ